MTPVFLGTSAFAAAILERLADSPHRPSLVVTRPDRPAGRGRRVTPPPVADAARALGLPLAQPERVNEERFDADLLIVCAYGALIREPLLSRHELLNVHPSLLPRWRGAAPVERAIMAGDATTGVCIMRVTAGLDSGPVCARGEEPIAPDDTYGTLVPRLEELGGDLLLHALQERPPFVEQPEEGVTYAEKIGPADRTLTAERTPVENERVVRALHPHIGARAPLPGGELLGVLRARVVGEERGGEVVQRDGRLWLGGLELLEVRPPGGRPMDAASFVRGRR